MKTIACGAVDVAHRQLRSSATGEAFTRSLELAPGRLDRLAAYHELLAPGHRASRPHSHTAREEIVFVIRGRVRVLSAKSAIELAAGGYAVFPAQTGVPHCIENHGIEDAEFLLVASAGHEDEVLYAPLDQETEGETPL